MRALNPIGLLVRDRMYLIPSRKLYPWTKVRLTGCNIDIPPPFEAAATSSGLEHGYIAPQIIGNSTPACLVKLLLKTLFDFLLIRYFRSKNR